MARGSMLAADVSIPIQEETMEESLYAITFRNTRARYATACEIEKSIHIPPFNRHKSRPYPLTLFYMTQPASPTLICSELSHIPHSIPSCPPS